LTVSGVAAAALGVVDRHVVDEVVLLVHLEGIGQQNSLERGVFAADDIVVRRLNVDSCNVVRQQHNFVGVNLVSIFVL